MSKKPAKPEFLEASPQQQLLIDEKEPKPEVNTGVRPPVKLVEGKKLGKSFGDALRKEKLTEGISWTADGEIIGLDNLSQSDKDKVQRLIEAHNPE